MVHDGQMKDPCWLNKRAAKYLEEYKKAQEHLAILDATPSKQQWKPPPQNMFKMNFDAAMFTDQQCSGFRAIIQNAQGEVMVGVSIKRPYVRNSEEAEALACRKAVIFTMEAGFLELVVEGDNVTMMRAISDLSCYNSLLGNIYENICYYLSGTQHASVSCIKRGGGWKYGGTFIS